jgi:hypothetical protein
MNDILLGIVLFVIYLCFVSCVIYSQKNSTERLQETHQPIKQAVREMLDEIYDEMHSDDEELEFAPIDQEKAEGRGQEAEGIDPDTFCTSIGATEPEQGLTAPTEKFSVVCIHEESKSLSEDSLLPSASCLLPFQDDVTPAPQQEEEEKKETHLPAANNKQADRAVNISKLSLRHARVACGVLDIQQKVNDRDGNIAWMQSQINQRIKENPEKIPAVYAAIADKFGVSVPYADQLLERLAC